MKKTILFAALAMVIASACSSKEDVVDHKEGILNFKISETLTKSVEAELPVGINITKGSLLCLKSNNPNTPGNRIAFDQSAITEAKSTSGHKVQVGNGYKFFQFIGNHPENLNKDVETFNGSTGTAAIYTTSNVGQRTSKGGDPEEFEVALNAYPAFSRIEVKNALKVPSQEISGSKVFKSMTVKKIFVNNIVKQPVVDGANLKGNVFFKQGLTEFNIQPDGSVGASFPAVFWDNVTVSDYTNGTKCSAFNIYPTADVTPEGTADKVFHIILQIDYELTPEYLATIGGGVAKRTNEYVTLTKFKKGGSLVTQSEHGKIYQIDLHDLEDVITIDKITPEPEDKTVDLTVKLTVVNWVQEKLTPEL